MGIEYRDGRFVIWANKNSRPGTYTAMIHDLGRRASKTERDYITPSEEEVIRVLDLIAGMSLEDRQAYLTAYMAMSLSLGDE